MLYPALGDLLFPQHLVRSSNGVGGGSKAAWSFSKNSFFLANTLLSTLPSTARAAFWERQIGRQTEHIWNIVEHNKWNMAKGTLHALQLCSVKTSFYVPSLVQAMLHLQFQLRVSWYFGLNLICLFWSHSWFFLALCSVIFICFGFFLSSLWALLCPFQ